MTKEEFKSIVKSTTRMPPALFEKWINNCFANGCHCLEEWSHNGEVPEVIAIHNIDEISYDFGKQLWDAREKIIERMPRDRAAKFINEKIAEFRNRQ